ETAYPADLAALGLVQAELRRIDNALTNLIEAIDIVETAEGEYSVTLVEYYRGLGRTYIKAGQYQQAIVSLEQAQHISQRNLGLFNVEQAAAARSCLSESASLSTDKRPGPDHSVDLARTQHTQCSLRSLRCVYYG
ncbi:MAG: tetratricopeptide repeat protein, partial [Bacteroidia bacterium]|nr:tetratricopeptide repeat protein [Bacteroidia bacterium]